MGPYAEGDHCLGSINNEDKNHCSTRAQILCLDWWFNLGLTLHLPTDVDLETRVRRVWTFNCSPQVFLNSEPLVAFFSLCFNRICNFCSKQKLKPINDNK